MTPNSLHSSQLCFVISQIYLLKNIYISGHGTFTGFGCQNRNRDNPHESRKLQLFFTITCALELINMLEFKK